MNRLTYLVSIAAAACLLGLAACSGVTDSKVSPNAGEPTEPVKPPFNPAVARTPKPSKALAIDPAWQPPAPTRSRPAHRGARVIPSKQFGVATPAIGPRPSDAELRAFTKFKEPLRPVPGTSSPEETEALGSALREESHDDRGIDALVRFLEAYPTSRWAPVLHLNIASVSYGAGYFQDALEHWKAAWELSKNGEDGVSTDIANLALAESARMNARIGRMTEVETLTGEAEKRNLQGDARVRIEGAAEGLWHMQNRPGLSFQCGLYALLNVEDALKPDAAKKRDVMAFLEKHPSPVTGFSLAEVHRMSTELGIKLQIAKREPGAAMILPAVVHWRLGHFGAIVREQNGKFRLKDPTFRNETWLSSRALDHEASGYFLVPTGPLPAGWTPASVAEAAKLFGKGNTDDIDPDDTKPHDPQQPKDRCRRAMADYTVHLLTASLHIEDTPIRYTAEAGPDVQVTVAYNQREASQPSSIDFTSFGPQFVSNWISYLVDDTTDPAADLTLRVRGGGGETHTGHSSGAFKMDITTASVLYRLTSNTYKKVYPDGRVEYYEQYIGTSGTQRRVFLTREVDPQGNEVTLQYDSTYPTRISQIVDATGLATVFHYDYSGEPYLVTSIDDPYGRTATFAYVTAAGKLRLQSTEDPEGIVSTFTYDSAGQVSAMTTPYGTTKFDLSAPYVNRSLGMFRYVEVTDPLGQSERVEYNVNPNMTGVPSSLETPQPSTAVVNFNTSYNNYRNTFYWDKLAMKLARGDYLKAHRFHWLHHNSLASTATGILESEVPPLESRIYYNYPVQSIPVFQPGSIAFPSVVARVVKDSSGNNQTQATKYQYNTYGNVTKTTDPLGRETLKEYASNGVDVTAIKRRTGTSGGNPVWTTVSTFTYGTGSGTAPHRPSSMTDGAGQTTSYTYTATGKVATITNAKSEVTTFTYETNTSSAAYDRVLSITGDVPGGNRSFTYDTYGRLSTTTDSEGYVLTYDYDNLDRVRTTTYPDGSFEQFEYEDHSLVATRDREGRWTRHMFNALEEKVLSQDPAFRQTQFQWCRCGQLRRFVDGNGNITEWERDAASRVTKQLLANSSFHSYTYDLSGRLATEVDPMSRTTTYSYNVDDSVAKKDYSDSATPDVTYTYETWYPRLATRVDGAGTTSFTYHPDGASTLGAGRAWKINGPLTDDTLKHTYDELGRLKKLEIVDNSTQTTATYSEEYTFDARARVTGVQNNLGSSTYAFVGQSGRPSSANYPNGMQVLYDYFGATSDFLLKQIKNLSSGGTPTVISQFDYTYRQDRSIDTWTVDQGSGATTWTFGYDEAKELTSAKRANGSTILESNYYGYDKAGNRIQVGTADAGPKNYSVNNLNQLMSERGDGPTTFSGTVDEPATVTVNGQPAKVMSTDGGAPFRFEALLSLDGGADGGTSTVVVQAKDGQNNTATTTYSVTAAGPSKTFEYDANGNLRYEKQPNGTTIREYRWDQQKRLVRVLEGTHESVYEYDGESHRTRIKELTSSVETKNETFVWCGPRICQKRSGSTVLRNYFGQGFEEGSNDYFYTRDHLGSVREVMGSDGISVASRVSYDPWGNSTETGSGAASDFGRTGHYLDRPTSLSLTHYRGYSPLLGRWVSRDPIGIVGGLNLYGYTDNNPINYIDTTGRHPEITVAIIVLAYFLIIEPNLHPTVTPPGPGPGGPGPGSPGPSSPGPGGPGPDVPDGPGGGGGGGSGGGGGGGSGGGGGGGSGGGGGGGSGGGGGGGGSGGGGILFCPQDPPKDDPCITGFVQCKNTKRYTYGNSVCTECLRLCQGQGYWPATTWSGRSCN